MKKSKMHILVGIHTSGKSSTGRNLSEHGFSFFPEIALDSIRDVGSSRPPWELDSSFDELVIRSELERDEVLLVQPRPFFVESWHIGNLAHARLRDPNIADGYEEQIQGRVRQFNPLVYFLDIPPDIIPARTEYFSSSQDRRSAVAFYSRVRTELFKVIDLLSLDPTIIDASRDIETTTQTILEREALHCSCNLLQ